MTVEVAEMCCTFYNRGRIHCSYRSLQGIDVDEEICPGIGFQAREVRVVLR